MHDPTTPTTPSPYPKVRVGDDVHASIEHDAAGNPVIVLIAPLELDEEQ